MVSVTPISVPFLPISYLCARGSFLITDSFDLGYFIVTVQWKLMTIGTYYIVITIASKPSIMAHARWTEYNSLPSGGTFYWTKLLQNSMSQHNVTNSRAVAI